MKIRKISIPIHIKLISFVLSILILALGGYAIYAINLFKNDKLAYVFQTVDEQKKQMADKIRLQYSQIDVSFRSFINNYPKEKTLETILRVSPMIDGFLVFKANNLEKSLIKGDLFKDINLEEVLESQLKTLSTVSGITQIKIPSKEGEYLIPVLIKIKNGLTFICLINDDFLQVEGIDENLYTFNIFNNTSYIDLSENRLIAPSLLERIKSLDIKNSTFAHNHKDSGNLIVTVQEMPNQNFLVVGVTDFGKAMLASKELREKSLYFALLVIGILIFLILIFSKIFTVPIDSLYKMSSEIAKNNFSYRVNLKNRDELGVLSDSFNSMAADIAHYVEEMKEKSRIENELKTAQLVQSSFFPDEKIIHQNFNLSTYYSPASECGGDWWGHIVKDHKLILIIADVTGHGTPAALMTAILHNSITSLKELSLKSSDYIDRPELIMSFLNKSVCSINTDLMATAFVAVLDFEKRIIKYTNASHNPPLKFNLNKEIKKSTLVPLMDANSQRLGENIDSEYQAAELSIDSRDKILLFTDGIIEAENLQAKMFGQRNFIKLIEKYGADEDFIKESLSEFSTFQEGVEANDDITLVSLEIS